MNNKYRPDIDGLRAVAIIPVVFFHVGMAGFSGGYVGVDVFFVISGFLITSILLADLESKRYSIIDFYSRRIRRIFPVLITVLLVTTFFSMWLMFPDEFKKYQSSLVSTLLFYSNYLFMFDVGYFAIPAETNPLLHMWSLAVEEQFYLIFPVYLFFMHRFFKSHMLLLTVVILLLSFIYSVYLTQDSMSESFYSTPSRAWELLLGSILAFVKEKEFSIKRWQAEVLVLVGLFCIIFSIFSYSDKTIFPGVSATVPVIGTALIIFVGCYRKTFVSQLLSLKPMVFIGLISYSLYLWHWPVMVFHKKFIIGIESQYGLYISVVLTFILAYLSWRFIETPFRKGNLFDQQQKPWRYTKGVSLVFGIGIIVFFSVIDYQREFAPNISKILSANDKSNKAMKLSECEYFGIKDPKAFTACTLGDKTIKENTFAIIGDSHGQMLLEGLDVAAKKFGRKGLFIGKGGCLALVGVQQTLKRYNQCQERIDSFLEYLASNPNIKDLMLISRWSIYANSTLFKTPQGRNVFIKDKHSKSRSIKENQLVFDRSVSRTMKALQKLNVNVYVLAQIPDSQWSAKEIALAQMIHHGLDLSIRIDDYIEKQRFVNEVFLNHQTKYGFQIIFPADVMCNKKTCQLIDPEGVSIYRDHAHITSSHGVLINQIFDPFFAGSESSAETAPR